MPAPTVAAFHHQDNAAGTSTPVGTLTGFPMTVGDLLVAWVGLAAFNGSMSTNVNSAAGWTFAPSTDGANANSMSCATRKIVGGDTTSNIPAPYTGLASSTSVVDIYEISGQNSSTPVNQSGHTGGTGTGSSVTTTVANCLMIGCMQDPGAGGTPTVGSSPSTTITNDEATTADSVVGIDFCSHSVLASAGTFNWTYTGYTVGNNIIGIIAIAPSTGGGGGNIKPAYMEGGMVRMDGMGRSR